MSALFVLLALCVFGMIAFVVVVSHLQTRGHGAVWSGGGGHRWRPRGHHHHHHHHHHHGGGGGFGGHHATHASSFQKSHASSVQKPAYAGGAKKKW